MTDSIVATENTSANAQMSAKRVAGIAAGVYIIATLATMAVRKVTAMVKASGADA